MQVPALCITLVMLQFDVLKAKVQNSQKDSFLRVIPNKVQHFQYDPVSFHCVGFEGQVRLSGIKNTGEPISVCKIKRTSAGSSCSVDTVYLEDSGEYWCETTGGERSNSVNITVTAGPVILESPALVSEGENVILRCRNKTNPTKLRGVFYKDGTSIQEGSAGEMNIRNVSKSDEGMYKCSISGVGTSPESWLLVRASPHEDASSEGHGSPRLFILLWVLLSIVIGVLVMLLVLHIQKHKASGDETAEDPYDVTYTTVVMKPISSRGGFCPSDEDESSLQPVYSTLTRTDKPRAAGSGSSPNVEQEVMYSAVSTVTKRRET